MSRGPGRPRTVSRDILQEAAFELFQRYGYAGTTVSQIARAAGVSRASFFHYFSAKSEVFWVEVDAALSGFRQTLRELGEAGRPEPAEARIRSALQRSLGHLGPAQVPWALSHGQLLGRVDDLYASGLGRIAGLAGVFERELSAGDGAGHPRTRVEVLALSYALAGAVIAAVQSWVGAGLGRGILSPYLDAALDTVLLARVVEDAGQP